MRQETLPAIANLPPEFKNRIVHIRLSIGRALPSLFGLNLGTPKPELFEALLRSDMIPLSKDNWDRKLTWVITHYFMTDSKRRLQFVDYLKRTRNHEESIAAFKAATGLSPKDLADIYVNYIHKGMNILNYKGFKLSDSDLTTTDLPQYKYPLPLVESALKLCQKPEYGHKLLSQTQEAYAKFPDNRFIKQTYARAHINYGDPNLAIKILSEELTKLPNDYELQQLLGRAYIKLAERGEDNQTKSNAYLLARKALGKAYQLDPSSSRTLYHVARANANLAGFPDDNTLNAVQLAQDYSYGDYNFYQAELFIRKGRYEDAFRVLHPEISPYKIKPDEPRTALYAAILEAVKAKAPLADILIQMRTYDDYEAPKK